MGNNSNRMSLEQEKQIIERYNNGDSFKIISKEYNIGTTSVSRILKKNNIATRKSFDYLKYTVKDVKLLLREHNYNIFTDKNDSDSISTSDRIYFKDVQGYIYESRLSHFMERPDSEFRFITKTNKYTIHNVHLWIKLNNKQFELKSETYVNSNNLLTFYCLKCKKDFEVSWDRIRDNDSCLHCRYLEFDPVAKMLKEQEEDIVTKYKDGLSFIEIAKEYDVNSQRLGRIIKRNDVELRHNINREKYSIRDVKELLLQYNYELITQYSDDIIINTKDRICFTDIYGYLYNMTFNNFKSNSEAKFPYVGVFNKYSIENLKLWLKLNNRNFELVSEEYIEDEQKLIFKCLDCKEPFIMSWNQMSGKICSCPCCGDCIKQVSAKNNLAFLFPDLEKEWDYEKNYPLKACDVTSGSEKSVWWKCEKCGRSWKQSVGNRTGSRKLGCPKCNKSKGEKIVAKFLDDNNIEYIPQMKYEGLFGSGGRKLSYDFYLEKYNILIEFQGKYHDGTAPRQNNEDYEKQKEHDRRKKEYAINQNIKLLEIWYWDSKNINNILTEELKINY